MIHRILGILGLSVSDLIPGTMGFGTKTQKQEASTILNAFVDPVGWQSRHRQPVPGQPLIVQALSTGQQGQGRHG